MNSGGGDRPPSLYPPGNGGEFLLQLLRKPAHQPPTPPLQQTPTPSQNLSHDPAVAAVGPALNFPPIQSSGHDLPYQYSHSPPFAPHNFFRSFPPNPNPNPNSGWIPSSPPLTSGFQNTGVSGSNPRPDLANHGGQSLMFGSVPYGFRSNKSVMDGDTLNSFISGAKTTGLSPKESKIGEGNRRVNGFEADFRNSPNSSRNLRGDIRAGLAIVEESRVGEGSRRLNGLEADFRNSPNSTRNVRGDIRAGSAMAEVRQPPPGFQKTPSNRNSGHNVDRKKNGYNGLRDSGREKRVLPDYKKNHADMIAERRLSNQLDCPSPPAGTDLHSVSAFEIEESMSELHGEIGDNEDKHGRRLRDDIMRVGGLVKIQGDLDEQYMDSLEQEDGSSDKNHKKQSSCDKDYRSDTRGQRGLSQRIRNFRRQIECRGHLDDFCAPLVAIYESLIPPEEEKMKQKQLLALLEKLVTKEWPEARLFVYGSCANSFGVVKSDIDICLTMEDPDVNKSEVLLKLADILQSDNLENVQALTRARVPIVKLMDPVTGISCDICLNNVLAVVNSKLLRDYANIDVRLQQLAFIVKHWAKTRGVNETYRGTLSSYAYVLMCIHFLQQRIPAILPCLQGMDKTYAVTVDNIECAYFHQVEKLSGFGSRNRESIAQLVWAFFHYWAYCHDYAHDVVSVRTGRILSKRDKDWTRRVGNDRHLICIEDPFEISHDLGRVVDKNSIKVLKEEFIRAAEILQCDPNPCVRLFEPYIPS